MFTRQYPQVKPAVMEPAITYVTGQCDRHPSARAQVTVLFGSGRTLSLCGHCAREATSSLLSRADVTWSCNPVSNVVTVTDQLGTVQQRVQDWWYRS